MQVTVRKHGSHWRARARWTDENGIRHEQSMTTSIPCDETTRGKNRALAEAKVWAKKINTVSTENPGIASMTVYDYCSRHYETMKASGTLGGYTLLAYQHHLNMMMAYFGNKSFLSLTTEDIEGLLTWEKDRGYASTTIRKHFNIIRHCCRYALSVRQITYDPTSPLRSPKITKPLPNPLTEDSRRRFVSRLSELDTTSKYVCAAWIAYYTGMRRGEVCGLRWRDVDLDASVLAVRRSISTQRGGDYIKTTKTDKERIIPITSELIRILRARRALQIEQCMQFGTVFHKDIFVTGDITGDFLSPNYLSRWWTQHVDEWGLVGTQGRKPVLHDLRHTFATIAVRSMDIKSAQDILGHADINMTSRYADTDLQQIQAAGNALDKALGAGSGESILDFKQAK